MEILCSNQTITKPIVLVVEGISDKQVFENLFKHLGFDDHIQAISIGGKGHVKDSLPVIKTIPGYYEVLEVLIIVCDADGDAASAFRSSSHALQYHKYIRPTAPFLITSPAIPSAGVPHTAVVILPSYNRTGGLEDLLLDAVRDPKARDCVDKYVECLTNERAKKWRPKDEAKAKLHAYLASRKDPEWTAGIAAAANQWDFDDKAFIDIINLITIAVSTVSTG